MSSRTTTQWPRWARQIGRAAMALGLGILVGLSAASPTLLLAFAAAITLVLLVASLNRPDPLVFLAFVVVCMPAVRVPGSPLPAGEALLMLAVFSAWLTRSGDERSTPRWFNVAAIGLVVVYVASSLLNGLVDYLMFKRTLHIVIYALVALFLAQGRLPKRIAARGLIIGLSISSLSGMILKDSSHYEGRLTGLFSDPNVAGFLLVALGPLAIDEIERPVVRRLFTVFLLVTVALTLSRTALLAVAVMMLWFVIGRRLKRAQALLLIGLVVLAIAIAPTSLQSIGPWSDRGGSDQLRTRVTSQEFDAVRSSPVWGHGAGTAFVRVNANKVKFFFHNSYLALMTEGGIFAAAMMGVLLFGPFIAMIALDVRLRDVWLEAALIGVAVMALNLGEVLVEISAAIAIGFAMDYLLTVRESRVRSRPERIAA